MKIISIILLYLFIASGCRKNNVPSPADTVAMLKQMEELATIEYTITKVVKANDNKTWYKAGERKILITTEASVKAGIDLKELNESDIERSGKSIHIKLPATKILSVNIPPEKVQVEFEKVTLFRDPFTVKERDLLMAQAERQIRNSGEALGILDQAKITTQLLISKLLMQAGFEKVTLTYDNQISGND